MSISCIVYYSNWSVGVANIYYAYITLILPWSLVCYKKVSLAHAISQQVSYSHLLLYYKIEVLVTIIISINGIIFHYMEEKLVPHKRVLYVHIFNCVLYLMDLLNQVKSYLLLCFSSLRCIIVVHNYRCYKHVLLCDFEFQLYFYFL